MIVIKVNYSTDQPIIKVNYDDAPIYISTTVDATYIKVDYGTGGGGGGAVWGDITGTLSDQVDLQAALDAKFDDPTGTTLQYIDGTGGLQNFPLTLPVLQEVRNQTGATVTAGTVVYINGATGNKPTIAKAIATGDPTSAQTLGMVQSNISNNGTGYVIVIGTCANLDTSAYTEGQQLYLSGTVAGGVTTTKPYAPTHLVYVGIVTRSHPTLGTIEVRVQNGYEMDELHDVSAQNPNNNDGLFYNTSTSLWESKSIATALGYTPGTVSSVALSVPTGLVVTGGSPITTSGTIAVGLQSGYSIPTTVKQGNWDDAYTFVSAFPSQTGNNGKYLTTDGSTLSWGTVSTANIYNSDGTLTGNRVVALGGNKLSIGAATSGFSGQLELGVNNASAISYVIKNSVATGAAGIVLANDGNQYIQIGTSGSSLTFPTANAGFIHQVSIAALYFTGGASAQPSTGDVIMSLFRSTKNVVIGGTTDAGFKADVQGTGRFTGNLQIGNTSNWETFINSRTSLAGVLLRANYGVANQMDLTFDGTGFLNMTGANFSAPNITVTTNLQTNGRVTFNGNNKTAYWVNVTDQFVMGMSGNSFITRAGSSSLTSGGSLVSTLFVSGNTSFGGSTDVASAQLQVDSTTKGFLQPRMTGTQRDAIVSPSAGLSIYNTTTNTSDFYNGTAWVSLAAGNIYTADGTLTGNRTVTMGSNSLTFSGTNSNINLLSGSINITDTRGGTSTPILQLTTATYNTSIISGNSTYPFAGGANSFNIYHAVAGPIVFYNGGSTPSRRFSILSDGKVVVGSQSSATKTFEINVGTNTDGIQLNATGSAANAQISINHTATGANAWVFNSAGTGSSQTAGTLSLGSTNNNVLFFATGNTVLGAANSSDAGYKLDVQGTGRFTNTLTVTKGAANYITLEASANGTSPYFQMFYSGVVDRYLSIASDLTDLVASSALLFSSDRTVAGAQSIIGSNILATGGFGSLGGSLLLNGTSNNIIQMYQRGVANRGVMGYAASTSYFQIRTGGATTFSNGILSTIFDNVGSVGIGGITSINASSILQVDSNTKGFLPPRMTETQKNAISTPATGLVIYQTDGTEGLYERTSTGWRILYNTPSGGSGITRSVNNISISQTASSAASTDYVYLISGTTTLTLPTAAGNTNRYTLKNVGTGTVTINTTSSQTIDGSTSITMAVRYTALDVISDGTNWNII